MRVPGRAGRPSTSLPSGSLVGVGFAMLVAATGVAAIAFGPHQAAGRLAVLTVVVGGFAVAAGDVMAALATAGIGWLFLNGLLVDQHAGLRWHATAAGLVRLAVLFGAALAGLAYVWLHRMATRDARIHPGVCGLASPLHGLPAGAPCRYQARSAQQIEGVATVLDVIYAGLTVLVFAVLGLVVWGVERFER